MRAAPRSAIDARSNDSGDAADRTLYVACGNEPLAAIALQTRWMRLRRSTTDHPGITRRRRGRGFSYTDPDGRPVTDTATLERISALVIPPAWSDVWICVDERGHLQAAGTDAEGRRQYRYHPAWTERAERRKYARVRELARHTVPLRRCITADLRGDDPRARATAIAARLIDALGVRLGDERYALEHGTVGALTLEQQHVAIAGDRVTLDFPAKSGVQWNASLRDADLAEALSRVPRGRRVRLTEWREGTERRRVGSRALTEYLSVASGCAITPKDLRTLLGSRTAAEVLARSGPVPRADQDTVILAAVDAVADALRNTRAVARSSYIDPLVIERFRRGTVATLTRSGVSDRAYADLVS